MAVSIDHRQGKVGCRADGLLGIRRFRRRVVILVAQQHSPARIPLRRVRHVYGSSRKMARHRASRRVQRVWKASRDERSALQLRRRPISGNAAPRRGQSRFLPSPGDSFLDANLFSSTLFVLTTLATHFKSGDIIFFDNFICSLDEFRAFEDFVESFRVKYEVLGAVGEYLRVCVKIL